MPEKVKVQSRGRTRESRASKNAVQQLTVPEIEQVLAESNQSNPEPQTKTRRGRRKERVPVVEVPQQEVQSENVVSEVVSSKLPRSREELERLFDSTLNRLRDAQLMYKSQFKNREWNAWMKSTISEVKLLKNQSLKSFKKAKKVSTGNKKSGFMKPVKISNKMADFAGWNRDDLRSRVDVTKYLCAYIKEHNLQNPENKKYINPDGKLADLLSYDRNVDNDLTYFTLQKKLRGCFDN